MLINKNYKDDKKTFPYKVYFKKYKKNASHLIFQLNGANERDTPVKYRAQVLK